VCGECRCSPPLFLLAVCVQLGHEGFSFQVNNVTFQVSSLRVLWWLGFRRLASGDVAARMMESTYCRESSYNCRAKWPASLGETGESVRVDIVANDKGNTRRRNWGPSMSGDLSWLKCASFSGTTEQNTSAASPVVPPASRAFAAGVPPPASEEEQPLVPLDYDIDERPYDFGSGCFIPFFLPDPVVFVRRTGSRATPSRIHFFNRSHSRAGRARTKLE